MSALLETQLLLLGLIAFGTSTIAGIFGFGGGMLFIGALPHFLPASTIIQLHAIVQWVSNSSRALLGWRNIQWHFVRQHLLGSLLGIGLAYLLFARIDLSYIPVLIGIYILLNTWSKWFSTLLGNFDSFYVLGAIQTGLGLLVGAPGPIPLPLLLKKLTDRHQIVCTKALFMTTGHTLKLALFIGMGFPFVDYWREVLLMASGAALGSVFGTHLRHRIQAEQFLWIVKLMLTALALMAIYRGLA